jgi:catechol 2,3-dioxygenase-like lactoylglutathione lyase family enzyme
MIDASTRIRVARPARDLAALERFYVEGLGLDVLWRTPEPQPYELLMVGPRGGGWHFEFARDPGDPVEPTPTVEDLFVLYLGEPVEENLVARLVAAGGTRVTSHNPYWDTYGVTIEDPDGYRLVLCTRTWDV